MGLPVLDQDKANHFLYGLAIGVVAYVVASFVFDRAYAELAATYCAMGAGAAKEARDAFINRRMRKAGLPAPYQVDGWDFVATMFGGLTVSIISALPAWVGASS